jgi:menaquinone-dependent protoporphyrinogen oxidase
MTAFARAAFEEIMPFAQSLLCKRLSRKKVSMSATLLLAYATRYGSTEEVATAIASTLRDEFAIQVDLQPMSEVRSLDRYNAVILGVPLYVGSWPNDADRFMFTHKKALTHRPVALFALGPVSDDPEDAQGSREQLDKELANYPWLDPVAIEIFVGKYDPDKLRFPDNLLSILPGSPLYKKPATDLRDWNAIRAWARAMAKQMHLVTMY